MEMVVIDTVKLVIAVPKEVYEKQQFAQYFGAWSATLHKHFKNAMLLDDECSKEYAVMESYGKMPTEEEYQ